MNQYIQCDEFTQVIINSETYGEFTIIVDNEDVPMLKNHTWGINKCWNKKTNKHPHFYAGCNMPDGRSCVLMHRMIMDAPKGKIVDHINGNKLDNRKCNLRICTQVENCENSKKYVNNISGHAGVCWDSTYKKWCAYIKTKRCNRRLGNYDDINEAIKARKLAEIRYFREYAYKAVEDIEYDLYFKEGYKVKKPSCSCLERYSSKIPDWTLATIIEDDINIPVKYDPNNNGVGYLRYLDYSLNFCPECGKPMTTIK
jgi:hypothetical protein